MLGNHRCLAESSNDRTGNSRILSDDNEFHYAGAIAMADSTIWQLFSRISPIVCWNVAGFLIAISLCGNGSTAIAADDAAKPEQGNAVLASSKTRLILLGTAEGRRPSHATSLPMHRSSAIRFISSMEGMEQPASCSCPALRSETSRRSLPPISTRIIMRVTATCFLLSWAAGRRNVIDTYGPPHWRR